MTMTATAYLESLVRGMTPDEADRTVASQHRAQLEAWLKADVGISRMRETGSWHHSTAIRVFSDADYFVTMPGSRPASSATALEVLRAALAKRIHDGFVTIDRPTVRIKYFGDGPAVEITPAYYRATDDYDIPDPDGTGWIRSNPAVHLEYVNNAQKETAQRAKGLIRIVKTWRAFNDVPLSCFYLEMRTAQYALSHKPILYYWDLKNVFRSFVENGLREMNDPTNYGRRISSGATSMTAAVRAKYAVEAAAALSEEAFEAEQSGDRARVSRAYTKLFNIQP